MFLIVGLPRTRSAWFAAYFSACGHPCIHEGIKYCNSKQDYQILMKDWQGDSSSAGMLMPERFDKIVIIERDKQDVIDSLLNQGQNFDYIKLCKILNVLEEQLNALQGLRVHYDDINYCLKEIHEYCVDTPYHELTAEQYKNMNIQLINLFTRVPKFLGELLWL